MRETRLNRGDYPVSVRSLTRRYGEFIAVDDVSFDVLPGEIFGFLGPNGAGKTTTIKMLTGLVAPSGGHGSVGGHDIRTERREIRRRIGYMSQRFSLYADLTVRENIDLFAGLYGVAGERLKTRRAWVLDISGLDGEEGRLTDTLPLGWKQRLALGCAMIHEPPILFLDEPTSGVDPLARRSFWDLIDGLAEVGTTVFVSTHYMEEAEHCHRLALLNQGRLIALDTPASLRSELGVPVYRVLPSDAPAAVHELEGRPEILEAALFGRALHVMTPEGAQGPEVIRDALSQAGIEIRALERVQPSLEDVFVSLVRAAGGARAG